LPGGTICTNVQIVETNRQSSTTLARWPSARSRRSVIVAQFGEGRADLAQWALTTADPLADAVAAAIHTEGAALRAAFDRGVSHGLSSLADPHPALAALLASTETRPDYADDELLDHGSAPHFTAPMPVHLVSLSAGALLRVYRAQRPRVGPHCNPAAPGRPRPGSGVRRPGGYRGGPVMTRCGAWPLRGAVAVVAGVVAAFTAPRGASAICI
jgi:hypothetical protein